MERLTFQTLEKMSYKGYLLKDAPERVLQFGEGNFLRAFADNFIDLMNEKAGFNGKVVLVQPRGGPEKLFWCSRAAVIRKLRTASRSRTGSIR